MRAIRESMLSTVQYKNALATLLEQRKRKRLLPMLVSGLCDGARFAFYASLIRDWRNQTGHGIFLIV